MASKLEKKGLSQIRSDWPPMPTPSFRIDVNKVLDQAKVSNRARQKPGEPIAKTARGSEIIDHAVYYFNEFGASHVSINQLAASLGMSTGNFHYHFRTSKDLYHSMFHVLNNEFRDVLQRLKVPMTLDRVVEHQIEIQSCLWHHRYFFRDLDYLVNSDESIFASFLHLQNWVVDQLVKQQEFYQENLNMRQVEEPNSSVEVAQNSWMMWISWIRWEAMANAKITLTRRLTNHILHRLVWHHFSLHDQYMSRKVAFAISRKLKERLLK